MLGGGGCGLLVCWTAVRRSQGAGYSMENGWTETEIGNQNANKNKNENGEMREWENWRREREREREENGETLLLIYWVPYAPAELRLRCGSSATSILDFSAFCRR